MARRLFFFILAFLALLPFSAEAQELRLPDVPDTLRTVEGRAGFVVRHFWDYMDFGDSRRARSRQFMEQAFVDFLSVFPLATEADRRQGAQTLLRRAAETDSVAYGLLTALAGEYLGQAASPMHSDEHYALFLHAELALLPPGAQADSLRLAARLDEVTALLPGSMAPDFSFTTERGGVATLHASLQATTAGQTLLVLHDPGCDSCQDYMDALAASPSVMKAVQEGRLSVLPVDVAAADEGTPALYRFTVLPAAYLLDRDATVRLKHPTVEEVERCVALLPCFWRE